MNFKINGLEGYFGGKGGSGTFQQIINIIPPHLTLVVPFLGHCGITRNIIPCQNWYLNDIDPSITSKWENHLANNSGLYAPNTTITTLDWRKMLVPQMNRKDVVFYLDPPYLHSTRKSNHVYNFELSGFDHVELLNRVYDFNFAKVIISCYDSALYQDHLSDFNKIQFQSMTRRGLVTETVYFNFDFPKELHDWRYMGDDFRQRCEYKRKRDFMIKKFNRMTPLEYHYFMNSILKSRS